MMQTLFITDKVITYDGKQLRSSWSQDECGVDGDCLVAFIGPASVATADLVDLEDQRAGAQIRAESMLHFIGQFYDIDLDQGVLLQRLLMCIIKEAIETAAAAAHMPVRIRRDGDDLYIQHPLEGKMTVSIATRSPVSVMLHAAINIDPGGAPVDAAGLNDIFVDAVPLGYTVLTRFKKELEDIEKAQHKVRAVE